MLLSKSANGSNDPGLSPFSPLSLAACWGLIPSVPRGVRGFWVWKGDKVAGVGAKPSKGFETAEELPTTLFVDRLPLNPTIPVELDGKYEDDEEVANGTDGGLCVEYEGVKEDELV
jgi:hypothetical protein